MKANFKRSHHFLADSHKKSFPKIVKETLQLWMEKKEFPYHYFGRHFYRTDAPTNFKDYLSVQQYNRLIASIVYRNELHPTINAILNDKFIFHLYASEQKLRVPNVFSYNFRNTFFFNNTSYKVTTETELIHFFKLVLKTTSKSRLFLKINEGCGGYGAILLDEATLSSQAPKLFKALTNNSYIHQELAIQHEAINKIYSKSINTLRVETFINKKDEVHIVGTFMRFGSGNSFVDNVSQGGFYVPITEKGTLFKKAITSLIKGIGHNEKHPDTGFVFDGFKIPFYKEAIELAKTSARLVPCYLQGWDIAITADGPMIIECNYSPSMLYSEYSYNGYKNNPVFIELMNDAKAYHSKKK